MTPRRREPGLLYSRELYYTIKVWTGDPVFLFIKSDVSLRKLRFRIRFPKSRYEHLYRFSITITLDEI